jgi:hypothetical protein
MGTPREERHEDSCKSPYYRFINVKVTSAYFLSRFKGNPSIYPPLL